MIESFFSCYIYAILQAEAYCFHYVFKKQACFIKMFVDFFQTYLFTYETDYMAVAAAALP